MKSAVFLLLMFFAAAQTEASVPVSVTRFENKAGSPGCDKDWWWWRDHLGSAFQDMLITALQQSEAVEVLERETIKEIYEGEHGLVNSDEDVSLAKGKFRKARYTFVGAVSEYEYCASDMGGGVNIGALAGWTLPVEVKMNKSSAKVAVDIRMIDTVTGRIVKSVRAEGDAADGGLSVDLGVADFAAAKKTPVGQAARAAIEKATKQLLSAL